MNVPLSIVDINNIFAVMTFTLVFTSIIMNPYYGKISLEVKSNKIRKATVVSIILFILTLIIRVFDQIIFV